MKYFELPDSPKTRSLNIQTLRVLKDHPEWFVNDATIDAVYGCPTECIWNGGCINFEDQHLNSSEINEIFDQYNNLGIGYRLTFTNRLLEDNHLNDVVGNNVLRLGYNDINAVIVANDNMENYIRQSFPRFEVIQSVCRVYETKEEIDEHSKNSLLCLPIHYNNDWEKLSKLKHPNNLMVIVNEFCPRPDCTYIREHYESDNRFTLGLAAEPMECIYKALGKQYILNHQPLPHHITQDLYCLYERIGIIHFKINGRGRDARRLLSEYAKFLIKDDCQELFCQRMVV